MTTQAEIEKQIQLHCGRSEYGAAAALAVETYGTELLRFLSSLARDPDVAAELFSQASEDIFRGIATLRWQGNLRIWSLAVARNAWRRHLRSPAQRKRAPLTSRTAAAQVADSVRERTAPYLRTDVKERFARLRTTLLPEEQELLSLRIDRRLSWTEIAEVLSDDPDIDPTQLKREAAMCRKRLERLITRLRELAKADGLLEADDAEP